MVRSFTVEKEKELHVWFKFGVQTEQRFTGLVILPFKVTVRSTAMLSHPNASKYYLA